MSQCPKIILYIRTKQINFLRNSSDGHFRTPSLSWYSFSDPQMTRVARLCIDSILLMCFTKQTWQPHSKIGCTKVLYAVETPSELFGPKVRLIKPRTLLALVQISFIWWSQDREDSSQTPRCFWWSTPDKGLSDNQYSLWYGSLDLDRCRTLDLSDFRVTSQELHQS